MPRLKCSTVPAWCPARRVAGPSGRPPVTHPAPSNATFVQHASRTLHGMHRSLGAELTSNGLTKAVWNPCVALRCVLSTNVMLVKCCRWTCHS
jgi:hypothetical protein